MELVSGLVYAALFAATGYFVFTVNEIAEASSRSTRLTIKASLVLLVIIPIVGGVFSIFNGDNAIYYKLGSIISSALGMYFITSGIKNAVIEAYARNPEAEIAAEEAASKEAVKKADEELEMEEDWVKDGEWKINAQRDE